MVSRFKTVGVYPDPDLFSRSNLFRPLWPTLNKGFVPSMLPAHVSGHGPTYMPLIGQNLTETPNHRNVFYRLYLANDVERNPGPNSKECWQTLNVRGLSSYSKLKRVLNLANDLNKYDSGIMCLQETHLQNDKRLEYMWKGDYVLSPSENNARGTLLLFTKKSFEKILYRHGSDDGRSAWLIGQKDGNNILIIGIYGPNHHHAGFYKEILNKADKLISEQDVDQVYVLGDLNININTLPKGKAGVVNKDKRMAVKIINKFFKLNKMHILSDHTQHTWQRQQSYSTLDFIIGPLVADKIDTKVSWGAEISDHALVQVISHKNDHARGPGLPRINTGFLDKIEEVQLFREEVSRLMDQAKPDWNPHERLEYLKMAIRSAAFERHSIYKKKVNEEFETNKNKLDALHLELEVKKSSGDPTVLDTIEEINNTEILISKYHEDHSKHLAQRARIQWIEKGEKNNKYFMNLLKYNERKERINALVINGNETSNQDEIKAEIHRFYNELYSKQDNASEDDMDRYLGYVSKDVSGEDNTELTKEITLNELTITMKDCKGTTPGPDGISTLIYKVIWDVAGPIILDAWNYSITIGSLSPSQKVSAICLLTKKGKDKRHVGNLRPITLSNCDLKFITKLYTKRINNILAKIININQSAYIPGRQVHDGLRLIDEVKRHCSNKQSGYLVSLDAKKAYDSVSHKFIEKTLTNFGFSDGFVHIFNTLYNDITTKVLVNGFQTENIHIGRGVKQGDALSCSLFILLMETLIRNLERNDCIKNMHLNGIKLKKVTAFADDIAIITSDKPSIINALKTYEEFSTVSGLYINPEKTEILNLRKFNANESFHTNIYGNNVTLNTTKEITICGKTFSLDPDIEVSKNIDDKITKLEKQLNMWKKRKLTIEGKILIVKTFAISQTLYTMQNTYYPLSKLKKIETLIYKYIWNGIDRIKRDIIKKHYKDGGLKGPDIFLINQTCHLKQVLRSKDSLHDIAKIQGAKTDIEQLKHTTNSPNLFVISAVSTLNHIGNRLIKEMDANDGPMHKQHSYNLSLANLETISEITQLNPIQKAYLRAAMKSLHLNTLKDVFTRRFDNAVLSETINKLSIRLLVHLEKAINEETTTRYHKIQ